MRRNGDGTQPPEAGFLGLLSGALKSLRFFFCVRVSKLLSLRLPGLGTEVINPHRRGPKGGGQEEQTTL